MDVNVMNKPVFGRDQIVSATTVSKKFAEVRKRAKLMPLFIADRNEIDSVIMDYQAYEDMYMELEALREQQFYAAAAQRVFQGDADPNRRGISLADAMSSEEYRDYQAADADLITDEDLFE